MQNLVHTYRYAEYVSVSYGVFISERYVCNVSLIKESRSCFSNNNSKCGTKENETIEQTLFSLGCYGRKLQDHEQAEIFAAAMTEMGECMKQIADLKYALDDNVKQNFLEPLHHTQSKDLKEVMHHRKKLQGRKLDYDCKRRKGATEEEIRLSEDKFSESLQLAQLGMHNLMDGNGVEHISQVYRSFAHKSVKNHDGVQIGIFAFWIVSFGTVY